MSFALFVCSAIFLVLSIILVIIAMNVHSEQAGWSGVAIGIVSLGASLYFGIQAHSDSQLAGDVAKQSKQTVQSQSDPPDNEKTYTRQSTEGPTVALNSVVPKQMTGRWGGLMEQAGDEPYTTNITLTDGILNEAIGTSDYPSLKCSGTLTLTAVDSVTVVADEHVTDRPGGNCVPDDEAQMQLSGGKLVFTIYFNNTRCCSATLTRRY